MTSFNNLNKNESKMKIDSKKTTTNLENNEGHTNKADLNSLYFSSDDLKAGAKKLDANEEKQQGSTSKVISIFEEMSSNNLLKKKPFDDINRSNQSTLNKSQLSPTLSRAKDLTEQFEKNIREASPKLGKAKELCSVFEAKTSVLPPALATANDLKMQFEKNITKASQECVIAQVHREKLGAKMSTLSADNPISREVNNFSSKNKKETSQEYVMTKEHRELLGIGIPTLGPLITPAKEDKKPLNPSNKKGSQEYVLTQEQKEMLGTDVFILSPDNPVFREIGAISGNKNARPQEFVMTKEHRELLGIGLPTPGPFVTPSNDVSEQIETNLMAASPKQGKDKEEKKGNGVKTTVLAPALEKNKKEKNKKEKNKKKIEQEYLKAKESRELLDMGESSPVPVITLPIEHKEQVENTANKTAQECVMTPQHRAVLDVVLPTISPSPVTRDTEELGKNKIELVQECVMTEEHRELLSTGLPTTRPNITPTKDVTAQIENYIREVSPKLTPAKQVKEILGIKTTVTSPELTPANQVKEILGIKTTVTSPELTPANQVKEILGIKTTVTSPELTPANQVKEILGIKTTVTSPELTPAKQVKEILGIKTTVTSPAQTLSKKDTVDEKMRTSELTSVLSTPQLVKEEMKQEHTEVFPVLTKSADKELVNNHISYSQPDVVGVTAEGQDMYIPKVLSPISDMSSESRAFHELTDLVTNHEEQFIKDILAPHPPKPVEIQDFKQKMDELIRNTPLLLEMDGIDEKEMESKHNERIEKLNSLLRLENTKSDEGCAYEESINTEQKTANITKPKITQTSTISNAKQITNLKNTDEICNESSATETNDSETSSYKEDRSRSKSKQLQESLKANIEEQKKIYTSTRPRSNKRKQSFIQQSIKDLTSEFIAVDRVFTKGAKGKLTFLKTPTAATIELALENACFNNEKTMLEMAKDNNIVQQSTDITVVYNDPEEPEEQSGWFRSFFDIFLCNGAC